MAGLLQGLADVVDRQILLAQANHLLAHPIPFRGDCRSFLRRSEERAVRMLAKRMAEHTEAAGRVTKAACRLGGGESLDVVRAQGLVLAMGGVAWLEEAGGDACYLFVCAVRHSSTMSNIHETVKLQWLASCLATETSCKIAKLSANLPFAVSRRIYDDCVAVG